MFKTFIAQVKQKADSHVSHGDWAFGKMGNTRKGTDTRTAEKELSARVKCRQADQQRGWNHFNITASFCRADRILSPSKNNRASHVIVCFLGSNT